MGSITGVLPKRHGFLKGTHLTASEPRTCSDRNPAQHSSRRASHHLPCRALQRGLRGQGEKQGGERGDTRKPPLPPNHPPPRGRLQLVSRQSDDVAGQKPTAFLSTWISLSLASHACGLGKVPGHSWGLGHSHTKPHLRPPSHLEAMPDPPPTEPGQALSLRPQRPCQLLNPLSHQGISTPFRVLPRPRSC